ncbi:MAG: hypothetical protein HC906_05265 [Bacteroidales bacterium]|nr:hypothetical protein [Bacteroidales bacterium]
MNQFRFIIKSLVFYFQGNWLIACGIAISTIIITGSLLVGDSVKHSLEQTVYYRLGPVSQVISAGERLFTCHLGNQIEKNSGIATTSVLFIQGSAISPEKSLRLNPIQVYGIDTSFSKFTRNALYENIREGEVIINENVARRLKVSAGDYINLQINKKGIIPLNTPFVSENRQTVTRRVKICAVVDKHQLGNFNINTSQVPPNNIL